MKNPDPRGIALTSLAIALSTACAVPPDAPDNVILVVADGAGIAHWTLAAYADPNLAMRQFRTVGLVDTRGADHVVTGSAASATALATGVRTYLGGVGVGPDSVGRETMLEVAAGQGMATGIVTTTFVVDATPAAFTAHVTNRARLAEIASQMGRLGVNVIMGGGRLAFLPTWRADSIDLLGQLRQRYAYVETGGGLRQLDPDTVTSLLGLFADGEMGVAGERSPSLPEMVSAALAVVDGDPDGFFLLVENEESDTQAHGNAAQDVLLTEMLDLDAAVRLALEYQEGHPETLVVVTSDHETGGVTLPHDEHRDIVMQYSTRSHTGALVPIFAKGPGAERFGGLLENREVGRVLRDLLEPPHGD